MNSKIYYGDDGSGIYSTAGIRKSKYCDMYANEVFDIMLRTRWREAFGLDIIQTMDLDFHTYQSFAKKLREYSDEEKRMMEEEKKKHQRESQDLMNKKI